MDYDDNEQSKNLHIAGEGSNKFPPVLHPYALPRFDFDESLHGSLRFDSLVETEVFLGIESNEDSQWIEDYSRDSSGIQFSSSAAESCTISRRNNVWSEATSSASVEMLLKSVGQEELIPMRTSTKELLKSVGQEEVVPASTSTKESDACDELGCIIKQMEPGLKPNSNIPARVGDFTDFQSTLLLGDENSSLLDDNGGEQQAQVEGGSRTSKGDESVSQSLVDLPANDSEVGLPIGEGNLFTDSKSDDVNQRDADTIAAGSFCSRTPEDSGSGSQIDVAVTTDPNISRYGDLLNKENASHQASKIADESAEVSVAGNVGHEEKGDQLSQGIGRHAQVLNAEMVESGGSHMDRPLHLASEKSMEETGTVESNFHSTEGPCIITVLKSGLELRDQSEVDEHEVLPSVVEGNTSVEGSAVEYVNSDSKDIVRKSRVSEFSKKDDTASQDRVDGNHGCYEPVCSGLPEVCSSVEVTVELHAEGRILQSLAVGSMRTCETDAFPKIGDVDKDDPVDKKGNTDLFSDDRHTDRITDKAAGPSSFVETSIRRELIVSKPQLEYAAVNESVDGIQVSPENGINLDTTVVDHRDVEVLPSPAVPNSEEGGEIAAQSEEACLADCTAASQVTTSIQSVPAVDICDTAIQIGAQAIAIEKVSQESTEDKDASPDPCGSTANKGDSIDVVVEENDGKEPMGKSEPIVNSEMHGSQPSALDEHHEGTSQLDQDKPAETVSGGQESSADLNKTKLIEGLSGNGISASGATDVDATKSESPSKDPNQTNASKDDSGFTFKISPLADLPQKDAKWQTFSNVEVSKAPIVGGSTSDPGFGQLVPGSSQDIFCGSPRVSGVATPCSASKGNSERRPRRAAGKITGKDTVRKGKSTKDAASLRSERGEVTSAVSMSQSVLPQLVQPNDMQRIGHIDSSSIRPFVLATSIPGLPDLNSSVSQAAVFQQPFTDLQQVQLRAQIFVYGALIQGTAPDEAYMISAFGGLDGGRFVWETAWRLCMERLHGQKSHLVAPETPVQSRTSTRATEQSNKPCGIQSKVVSSPIIKVGNKSAPVADPVIPLSSPLWSMSTGDTRQSSGITRGLVMDYQRALSPLQPHQTPAIRNFVGHSPFLSQPPFGAPWVASPSRSAVGASGQFRVQMPTTGPVQFTPVNESSVSHSSGANPTLPPIHSTIPTSIFSGPPMLDMKMVAASSGQPSADPKPRKRKKASPIENTQQILSPPPSQTESVTVSVVASPPSASVATKPSVGFVSTAPTEKTTAPLTPISSIGLMKRDWGAEINTGLSEEPLGSVKESMVQADTAATHAASAVSCSQDIWNQLDRQRNFGLLPDIEVKLASAAVSIAAAAAVAKAAAAAAKIASNAALQAKLMAEEALGCAGQSNLGQTNAISFPGGMNHLGRATPSSILIGDDRTNSSSILVAAREAARKRIEDASAAAKRAENMDAIVKAAELAAEAVSQAGKIVAMGDHLSLSELVTTGPENCWKLPQGTSQVISKSENVGKENRNVNSAGGPDILPGRLEFPAEKQENQNNGQGTSPTLRVISNEDNDGLADDGLGSRAISKRNKGQKGRKASDLCKTVEVTPESGIVSDEYEKAEASKENSIREDSNVEVLKNGSGFQTSWFPAKVLSLKDGKAYVKFTELTLGEGSEKLQEWVSMEGEGDEPPKIRIPRPMTIMPFEGTRKRRRDAVSERSWSVGDRVDAWMDDSWWEGVITEKSKKEDSFQVHFPAHGETTLVRKWNLRPSLIWKDREWIEWSSSGSNHPSSHGGDTPQEKRARLQSPVAETNGKDEALETVDAAESDKSDDPTLLALTANEKLFNVGKSTREGNRSNALRMTRTGLQKGGSRVIFGVPKPGKKRKFMEVSKHYVADRSGQNNEANDSVKFTRYLMPHGAGSRGLKSTSKIDPKEKRAAISKSKVLKSERRHNLSGRTNLQKENLSSSISIPGDRSLGDHVAKTKASLNHSEKVSEKQNSVGSQSFTSSGASEGPILFSAAPSDHVSSKKISSSNRKLERASKGRLAPAGGKFNKIEENESIDGDSVKSTSDPAEPRRSNRRIQPTSRLLEGLQTSLMVSKIPFTPQDRSQKNRNASRGNNQG